MVVLLVALVVLYAVGDRFAPSSGRGVVSAHVVQIAPRVSGEVVEVHVEDDAVVEAGAPLFSIDRRPFELAVRQAEANLETTVQGIDASSASLVAAQAQVAQARSALEAARADAERTFRLEERGIAAEAQGDAARASVADAEARVNTAEANLESARAQLGPEGRDNPAVMGAEAQLEQAQYDLLSTTVTAPHFGVVTNVTLSEGQFAAAGQPALTFIDADAAWVTVDLRENQLALVEPGDPAHLLFDAVPGTIFEGQVQSVAWGIDPRARRPGRPHRGPGPHALVRARAAHPRADRGRRRHGGLAAPSPRRRPRPRRRLRERLGRGAHGLARAGRAAGALLGLLPPLRRPCTSPPARAPRTIRSTRCASRPRVPSPTPWCLSSTPALPPVIAALPVGLVGAQRMAFQPLKAMAGPIVFIVAV